MDNLMKMEQFWKSATGDVDWKNRANRAFDFYKGKQWEANVIEALDREKRPHLTLNKIKPILRVLSGWQRQNRQDLKVLARRGGAAPMAEMFTELLKYFYDQSLADYENSMIFVDGTVGGKGWIALDIDYTNDPLNGELLLRRERPMMVYEDPYSQRYDLSDAKFVIRTRWANKDEIEQEFPKAKKDTAMLATIDAAEREPITGIDTPDYNKTGDIKDLERWRYLVKEYYWREYVKERIVVNTRTLECVVAKVNDEKAQRLVNLGPWIRIVDRVMPILHLTTVVGKLILQDVKDPFDGITMFPLVRFCSDWIDGYVKGEVDDLVDPQQEHNKRRSQALHILNTEAHSGYIIEQGALTPAMEAKLDDLGATPGIKIYVKKGFRFERITPGALSTGHVTLGEMSKNDLKEISNVNADLLGQTTERPESGKAMLVRRQQGLLGVETIFDNFQYTQQILGRTILEFIRKTDILSEEEMTAILQEKNAEADLSLLKSRKVGKYQVVMSTKKSTPTQRMADFYALLDAAKEGLPIPPDLIIEASDLPNKEAILEAIRQAQQAQIQASGGQNPPPV